MKKLVLFVFIAFSFGAQAQNFWTEVSPFPSDYSVRQIAIVDANIVWVYGYNFNFPVTSQSWSRSTDGGVTWTSGEINLGNLNLRISSIHATSANTAYATSNSGIWVTQDAGITWTQQASAFTNSDSFANSVYFWDTDNGIALGDPQNGYFEIYTTSNSGTDWTRVNSTPALVPIDANEYALTSKFNVSGDNISIGTTFGRILHSNDKGQTWTVSQSPIADFGGGINGSDSADIAYINGNNGLLQTSTWDLYATANGGTTWNPITPSGAFRNFSITQVPGTSSTYFSIGDTMASERGSSYSIDNGLSWIDLNSVGSTPVIPYQVKFQSGTVGFCIGYYEGILESFPRFYRLTDPLNRLLKTDAFEANQIVLSPNPTSGITKITGVSINEVTVFDVTGKEVYSNQYNALNEVSVNISALQNGMYLTKITDVNGNTATKKILKN